MLLTDEAAPCRKGAASSAAGLAFFRPAQSFTPNTRLLTAPPIAGAAPPSAFPPPQRLCSRPREVNGSLVALAYWLRLIVVRSFEIAPGSLWEIERERRRRRTSHPSESIGRW